MAVSGEEILRSAGLRLDDLHAVPIEIQNAWLSELRVPIKERGALLQAKPAVQQLAPIEVGEVQESKKSESPGHGPETRDKPASLAGILKNMFTAKTNFEDAESLLNNLLLFNAIVFAFSVALMTGTFGHDDLLEADARHMAIASAQKAVGDDRAYSIATLFLKESYVANVLLVVSMMVALFCSLSLGYSDCRESSRVMAAWLRVGMPLIFAAYILFFVGLMKFFFAAHLSVEMIYPRYPLIGSRDNPVLDPDSQRLWKLYNFTSQEPTLMTPADGLVGYNGHIWNNGLIWLISENAYKALTACVWTFFGVGTIATLVFNHFFYDDGTDGSKYEET